MQMVIGKGLCELGTPVRRLANWNDNAQFGAQFYIAPKATGQLTPCIWEGLYRRISLGRHQSLLSPSGVWCIQGYLHLYFDEVMHNRGIGSRASVVVL